MGIFHFLRRKNPGPLNSAPGWLNNLFRKRTDHLPGGMGNKIKKGPLDSIIHLAQRSNDKPAYLGPPYTPKPNTPNKAFNRLNLASKEARVREMQKRRSALKPVPKKQPWGRR